MLIAGCGPHSDKTVALQGADGGPGGTGGAGGDATNGRDGRGGRDGADGTSAGSLLTDPPPGTSEEAKAALKPWRDFPVDAEPRPIVMSGATAYAGKGEGYTFPLPMVFADPAELPDGPDEVDGFPVIGAKAALEVMHDNAKRAIRRERMPGSVTAMKFGSAEFWTDRGLQRLPAWLVSFRLGDPPDGGFYAPKNITAKVLAVAPAGRFGPLGADDTAVGLTPDGMSVLVDNYAGLCPNDATVRVVETRTAVVYRIDLPSRPATKCLGRAAAIPVHLSQPLGNRIVLNEAHDWFPYPVVACGQQTWVSVPPCGYETIAPSTAENGGMPRVPVRPGR